MHISLLTISYCIYTAFKLYVYTLQTKRGETMTRYESNMEVNIFYVREKRLLINDDNGDEMSCQ